MPGWLDERGRNGGIDEVPLPEAPGRLWLCGKHLVGPDPDQALERTGASVIVCLNEAAELRDRYPDYVAWLTANRDGRAIWFPVPDFHAPPLELARPLLEEVRRRLADGDGVIVHCGAGIGRTGTVVTALLMTMGLARPAALARVAASRPGAGPEAGVQADLLHALEAEPT